MKPNNFFKEVSDSDWHSEENQRELKKAQERESRWNVPNKDDLSEDQKKAIEVFKALKSVADKKPHVPDKKKIEPNSKKAVDIFSQEQLDKLKEFEKETADNFIRYTAF